MANTPSLVNRMPPKNARVARPAAANQRATRRVTRSASQASSEAESRRGGAPENENPVEMPNVANAALLAELQRYRDAYGGHLPNGEAAADAGDNPIPPRAAQNPPPPPPPPAAPAVVHAPGPNYWDMLRHMKSMQTEFFNGKADAIVADNWRRQLERNFASARCPPEFRRDLAAHYLKDDALVWWDEVVERSHGIRLTWDDFLEAFNGKYFPLEAIDAMEIKFQDIRQGSRNVRDYGDEFNRLRRFVGHYLSDHDLIRRFLKGMRVELRNSCNVRDYRDVHERIEKAAEQESGLEEERKQNQNSQNRGAKRPRDTQPAAEPAPLRPACERCGRFHAGECRMGACFSCGERGHIAKDCPKERQGQRRRCYRCGQEGHLAWECPTLQRGNAEGAQPQQQRGQAAGARAYAVEGREGAEPIAGTFDLTIRLCYMKRTVVVV